MSKLFSTGDDFADVILTCFSAASGVEDDLQDKTFFVKFDLSKLGNEELIEYAAKSARAVNALLYGSVSEELEYIQEISERLRKAKDALETSLDECIERGIVPAKALKAFDNIDRGQDFDPDLS